jgi:hypothetical protein
MLTTQKLQTGTPVASSYAKTIAAVGFTSLPAELPLANEFTFSETGGTMTPSSFQTASNVLIGPTPTGTANNAPYATGRCFSTAAPSALHWADVTVGNTASNYPRTCGVGVAGSTSTFTNGVYALAASFAGATAWQIFTKVGTTITVRAAANPGTFLVSERMRLTCTHNGTNNVYTLYKSGVFVTSWIDTGSVITPGLWASVLIQGTYSSGWFAGQAIASASYGANDSGTSIPAFGGMGAQLGGSTSTTVDMAAPANIAVDDILVAYLKVESTATITPPSGWAAVSNSPVIGAVSGQEYYLHVFWKRAVVGDVGASTYSFTGSTGYRSGRMTRYSGCVASGNPFDAVTKASAVANSTTSPAVSLTTTGTNRLLLWQSGNFAGGTWSAPAGWTLRDNTDGQGSATLPAAAAGSTGSVTATNTLSGAMVAWLGALIPA